jgi:SAM-dependent methyltransferase
MTEPEWYRANCANWDERVGVHIGPGGYDLSDLRAGRGKLNAIEEAELPPVEGKRLAHLQCHFGADSLTLTQRGAEVIGLDFSAPAIEAARKLAGELGLADHARFVHADLYEALAAIPPPHAFDIVFVTWGAICWLPDISRWAQIVAALLRPGGSLYLAEGHPTAYVFDDATRSPDGTPGLFAPYFSREPVVDTEGSDYVDPNARLGNATIYSWIPSFGRRRLQPDRIGHELGMASRARCCALAHVQDSREECVGPLPLARQAVAAPRFLTFRNPRLAMVQEANCSLITRSSRLNSRS